MPTLFCHSATFARIAARLKASPHAVTPQVMDDAGTLSHPWGAPPAGDNDLIAYATQDAYFSSAAGEFLGRVMQADPLVWFQSSAAGLEHPVLRAIGRKSGVYTSSHEQSAAIAEWVLWAGLDHFQRGPERRALQAERTWRRMDFREISATHWLVVGFGHIGRASALRLRALGARVTGIRRTPGPDPEADAIASPDALPELLPGADAVLLCAPLTPETEGMADARFFAAMAPGALLLNVGRGRLVDEAALLAGLDAGRPGRAALDVAAVEPLAQESPLWRHPQVTLTPHISALTEQAKARTDALFLANLDAFMAGRPLCNTVPRETFAD